MGWLFWMAILVVAALFVRRAFRKAQQRRVIRHNRLFQYRDSEIERLKSLTQRKY